MANMDVGAWGHSEIVSAIAFKRSYQDPVAPAILTMMASTFRQQTTLSANL